jgi:imidazolonepropionase-like amidohydrolase
MKAAVEAADDWGTYVTVPAHTPKAVRRAVEAGVKCIEHGQLLDEAPATATDDVKAKKHAVVEGSDVAYRFAKKYKLKLA